MAATGTRPTAGKHHQRPPPGDAGPEEDERRPDPQVACARSPVPGPILGLLGTRTAGPPLRDAIGTPSPPAHGQPSVRFRQVPNTWDCIFRHVECFQKRATPLAHSTCPCSLEALSVWTVSLTGAHHPPTRKPSVSYPGAVIRPSRREREREQDGERVHPPPYSTYGPVPHPPPPLGPGWLATPGDRLRSPQRGSRVHETAMPALHINHSPVLTRIHAPAHGRPSSLLRGHPFF